MFPETNKTQIETKPLSERIKNVFSARFAPDTEGALNEYFEPNNRLEDAKDLLSSFETYIKNPELENKSLEFSEYTIPKQILTNNSFTRGIILGKVEKLDERLKLGQAQVKDVKDFFISEHEWIKFSTNQWLLATPGMALEIFTVNNDLQSDYLEWLKERFDVSVGDEIIHRHVVSGNGRERLRKAGYPITDMGYSSRYYAEGLILAEQLSSSVEKNKGIFARGSWIYDPGLYPSYGDSIVKFDWLRDDILTGERYFVRYAIPGDEQLKFALKNSETRKQLFEEGKYTPKVYGTFYPKDKLTENLPYIKSRFL